MNVRRGRAETAANGRRVACSAVGIPIHVSVDHVLLRSVNGLLATVGRGLAATTRDDCFSGWLRAVDDVPRDGGGCMSCAVDVLALLLLVMLLVMMTAHGRKRLLRPCVTDHDQNCDCLRIWRSTLSSTNKLEAVSIQTIKQFAGR